MSSWIGCAGSNNLCPSFRISHGVRPEISKFRIRAFFSRMRVVRAAGGGYTRCDTPFTSSVNLSPVFVNDTFPLQPTKLAR